MLMHPSVTLTARAWNQALAHLLVPDSDRPIPLRDFLYFEEARGHSEITLSTYLGETVVTTTGYVERGGVGWVGLREIARLLHTLPLKDDEKVCITGVSTTASPEDEERVGWLRSDHFEVPLGRATVLACGSAYYRAPRSETVTPLATLPPGILAGAMDLMEPVTDISGSEGVLRLSIQGGGLKGVGP